MKQKLKVYTAYHIYLSILLEHLLKDRGFEVKPMVKVGSLPLEVDIIIIKQKRKRKRKEFKKLDFFFKELIDYNMIELN